jgi:hypothetical protein
MNASTAREARHNPQGSRGTDPPGASASFGLDRVSERENRFAEAAFDPRSEKDFLHVAECTE